MYQVSTYIMLCGIRLTSDGRDRSRVRTRIYFYFKHVTVGHASKGRTISTRVV